MPLQAVESQRLYRQIADQVRTLIAQGEFVAGSRLPAERDLARQFGVSRPSVREALIALEVEGYVEVRTGSGVYVLNRPVPAEVAPASLTPTDWGPLEVIRARRVIEGETAALAAVQHEPRHLDAMAAAMAAMRAAAERSSAPLAGDQAFHMAIAEAVGNAVLVDTVHSFWEARHRPMFVRLGGYFETPAVWRAAIGEHEVILAAIAARDADAARAAMQRHMDLSHKRYSASWRRAQANA